MSKYTPKVGDYFLAKQNGKLLVAKVNEIGTSVFFVTLLSEVCDHPNLYSFFYSGKALIEGPNAYALELVKPITPEKNPEYFL